MVPIHSHLGRCHARVGRCCRAALTAKLRRGLWILPCLAATIVQAQNYEAQFNNWFAVQTNMQSWSAHFTQTRTLVAFSQPLVSTGKVWVEPGQFRWELGQPPQTIVVRKPDELIIFYPRLKRAEIYELNQIPNGPIKDAMALLDVSLPRSKAELEKNFQLVSATVTNSILQMTLQPRSVSARQFVHAMIIGFHTNDYLIADSEMEFADGSRLLNDFSHVVLNQPISPALFETNIPPDYTVEEPLNR
jgi:outer membrane lipoprotein-sorting protein